MPLFNLPSSTEKEYLFIDGGCLRASVKSICKSVFGDENALQPFMKAIASGGYDKVFYYDAIPGKYYQEDQENYAFRVQADHDRFERIRALDRVHVALGSIVGEKKNIRQKGVYVQLALDMLTHTFRRNIAKATLFAGDADFVPLIRALVAEGLHVTLWHPSQASSDLKSAADTTRLFQFETDYSCFTADGLQSAFQVQSATSMPPPNQQLFEINGKRYAGDWRRDSASLNLWREVLGQGLWDFVSFSAPGSTLMIALSAFDAIRHWDVSQSDGKWIAQR